MHSQGGTGPLSSLSVRSTSPLPPPSGRAQSLPPPPPGGAKSNILPAFASRRKVRTVGVLNESLGPVWANFWSDSNGVKLRRIVSFAQQVITCFLAAVPIVSKWPRYRHTASSSPSLSRLLALGRSFFDCFPAHHAQPPLWHTKFVCCSYYIGTIFAADR